MPACISFDPCNTQLLASQYDSHTSCHASSGMPILGQKGFAAFYTLQYSPQQSMITMAPAESRAASPFDHVPYEILDQILGSLHSDTTRGIYDILRDISACCLVSRQFHTIATTWLYRHVPISDPYAFTKFLKQISLRPAKGLLVKTLDFSPFSIVSLGRSANDNKQIKMVCWETLLECLNLCSNLQEVAAYLSNSSDEQLLLTEALDPDLDVNVLLHIFNSEKQPKLEAIDFCGCMSFVHAFEEMLQSHFDPISNEMLCPFPRIQRLSLHGCQNLPANVYPRLLSSLPHLTHLDLSSTQINSIGLHSIHRRCRLRHLYLGNCGGISGKAILSFLLDHPASTCLESLNFRISDELNHPIHPRDVSLFLAALKSKGTLKMLDICGMPVTDECASEFPTTLIELGVHRCNLSPQGILTLLSNMPDLFYLEIEANISGGRLRLSRYADVFTSIRHHHPHVRVVECSGLGIESTDEIYDILFGWHWLHGRSRRGWLINKAEYEDLQKTNQGIVKVGWKTNKLNCCSSRNDLHGHYWYYAYGR